MTLVLFSPRSLKRSGRLRSPRATHSLFPPSPSHRRAALLVVVLWTVAVLTIILGNLAFLTRTHLRLASNYSETNRLHNIAAAGIERAKAELLADEDPLDSLSETWANDETAFAEYEVGAGTFSLLRPNPDPEGEPFLYGLEDEASKINLHTATREMLEALEGMDEALVDALLDWQDSDSNSETNGAEDDYYSALSKPYPCKNAPLTSLDELLLVRGFTHRILYGVSQGMTPGNVSESTGELPAGAPPQPPEPTSTMQGNSPLPSGTEETGIPGGLAQWFTVHSSEPNTAQDGKPRVNIATADENQLTQGIPGLTQDEAQAIVAYRQQKAFQNLGDLLLVPATQPQPADGSTPPPPPNDGNPPPQGGRPGQNGSGNRPPRPQGSSRGNNNGENANETGTEGSKFSAERLTEIIDYCTLTDEKRLQGRININTAPVEVLAALPGMDQNTAQAIVDRREETGQPFATIAELLDVPELAQETFIGISNHLTVRSHQFRARSEARIEGVKATRTVIAILERNNGKVRPIYWHEY